MALFTNIILLFCNVANNSSVSVILLPKKNLDAEQDTRKTLIICVVFIVIFAILTLYYIFKSKEPEDPTAKKYGKNMVLLMLIELANYANFSTLFSLMFFYLPTLSINYTIAKIDKEYYEYNKFLIYQETFLSKYDTYFE